MPQGPSNGMNKLPLLCCLASSLGQKRVKINSWEIPGGICVLGISCARGSIFCVLCRVLESLLCGDWWIRRRKRLFPWFFFEVKNLVSSSFESFPLFLGAMVPWCHMFRSWSLFRSMKLLCSSLSPLQGRMSLSVGKEIIKWGIK